MKPLSGKTQKICRFFRIGDLCIDKWEINQIITKSIFFQRVQKFRNLVIQELQLAQRKSIFEFLTQSETSKPKTYSINKNYENKTKVMKGLRSKLIATLLSEIFFGNGAFVHPNNQ